MAVSELILNGILHLFALLTCTRDGQEREKARGMVAAYLSDYLGIVNTEQYLGLFDSFLEFYGEGPAPELLVSRTREVCDNLRGHIPRSEQYAVLLRFLALARDLQGDEGFGALVRAAGETLEIADDTLAEMRLFIEAPAGVLSPNLLVIAPHDVPMAKSHQLRVPYFSGIASVLRIKDTGTLFLMPGEGCELTLDGIPLQPGAFYPLPAGAILRDIRGVPVYYADIAARFSPITGEGDLLFETRHVDFRFPGSDNGLHDFSVQARGGQMVGVMGGSGVGKSTLVSILNGTLPPRSGQIRINGIDLYDESDQLEGSIGFVPQDDLLFNELTVYDNLYYSSRLCLSHLPETDLDRRVTRILQELGQAEIKDLAVGSPLEKTISGGQRKRLNIALELIREPAILFVDEPTSGLSSSDSLNVMTLLKEQSRMGRLMIVIIHQPSSDIFKMFDSLWIMDKGGRPVYTGNPIDALVYFRREAWQAGTEECICPQCGSVSPEQIFDIIEMKRLDEKGFATTDRRFSAAYWHDRHLLGRKEPDGQPGTSDPPAKALQRPSLAGQLAVFFKRNLAARLANRQYLAINLLEAPCLAWLIASLARYEGGQTYLFSGNHNIPVYFFMSVIVALFMGLSVSAEEIIRDRNVLSRERFLHLSWFSYISAKTLYLSLVAAVQMALFVAVGNAILEVQDFSITLWAVLFSCSVTAGMIGLNISATLKTTAAVYILIPLLLVPQMILGGMVIPFDDLIPPGTRHNRVPLAGNLMPSRWGFEAVAVAQFRNNPFQAPYNELDREITEADYRINYYLPELKTRIDFPFLNTDAPGHDRQAKAALDLLAHEVNALILEEGLASPYPLQAFSPDTYDREKAKAFKSIVNRVAKTYRKKRNQADQKRRQLEAARVRKLGQEGYRELERKYRNKGLVNLVRNRESLEDYRLAEKRIVRLSDPVFTRDLTPWGTAPMFAGHKRIGSVMLPTFLFNLSVLWLASAALFAALHRHLFARCLAMAGVATRMVLQMSGAGAR